MKKRSERPQGQGAAPQPQQKRSSLLRRLLGGLKQEERPPLPPAGRRSGEGTDSLEPFLQQERDTRPGSLE